MEEVSIRMAHPGDGPELARLHLNTAAGLVKLEPHRFRIPDAEGLAEWLDRDLETVGETWICFVAIEGGEVVGQVEARLHQPAESARYQVMSELGVVRGR